MGPDHVPLPCLEEVVLTSFTCWVFPRWPPQNVPLSWVGPVVLRIGLEFAGKKNADDQCESKSL